MYEDGNLIYLKNSKIVISIFYVLYDVLQILVHLIIKCIIKICKIIFCLILINKFQYWKVKFYFSAYSILCIRILSLSFKILSIFQIEKNIQCSILLFKIFNAVILRNSSIMKNNTK